MNINETCYFFFDYDNTLYQNGDISEQTIKALEYIQSLGHKVILHTGRSRGFFEYKNPAKDKVHFDGRVYGGCDIEYLGARHYKDFMQTKDVLYMIEYACKHKYNLCIENVQDYFIFCTNSHLDEYTKEEIEDIKKQYLAMLNQENNTTKFSLYIHNQWCKEQVPDEDIPKENNLYYIRHEKYMEFFPNGRSKSSGFLDFLKYYHVKKEQCVVFGDSDNDLDSFITCGFSVGMKNSTESILKTATYITKESDGVAEGIYWVLNQGK